MKSFLIEADDIIFHIEDTIPEDKHVLVVQNLKDGNYTQTKIFI